jgi:hypothetical protein
MGSRPSPGIEFVPDPIRYLQALGETTRVKVWRFAVDRHFLYSSMDSSVVSGKKRISLDYDHKWDCATCRPYKEEKEGRRILEGFEDHDMYLSVIANSDLDRVRRLARRLGASYVPPPCGSHRAVLSTLPLSDHSVAVEDREGVVMGLVMKLRWKGKKLGGTRGFLPPARPETGLWEAHHPSTARRCYHRHGSKEEAERCAVAMGERLDGSSKGWRARRTSVWRRLGTVRVDRKRLLAEHATDLKPKPINVLVMEELARIAIDCGLLPADARFVPGGDLVFVPVAWDDPRFIKFRQLTRWKPPGRSGDRWQPPTDLVTVRVDGRGRVSGAS